MITPLTRRRFLASASALAASALGAATLAACGGGGGFGSGPGAGGSDVPLALETDPNRRLARVERHHFEQLVGAPFRMSDDGANVHDVVNVTLTELVDRRNTNPEALAMGFREPFSLALRGPDGRIPRDGTYTLNHPQIGDIEVFVCYGGAVDEVDPSGEPARRNAYRVHFN